MKLSVLVLLLLLLLPADMVSAQVAPGGFVPCEGAGCSACHFVSMVNVIITWLFSFMFLVFAVVMFSAGFGLVTSGGNQAALDVAKSKFQNALVGIIIALAAWVIVDTVMRNLIKGDGDLGNTFTGFGPWSEVQCMAQTIPLRSGDVGELPEADGTPVIPSVTATCDDTAALMAKYSGSPIGLEAPGLRTMIQCYLDDPEISAITDKSQLFTVDRNYPRCSLTNGNRVCGECSHSSNSMHYGRGSGQGAKAVDFNASGASEAALYAKLQARKAACGGSLLFENNHTHISL